MATFLTYLNNRPVEAAQILQNLQSFESLQQVPQDQLQWLIAQGQYRILEEGTFLFKKGDPVVETHFVFSGEMRLYMQAEQQEIDLGNRGAGAITGFLPFSRAGNATAFAVATSPMTLLSLHKRHEKELITHHYELAQVLVHTMTSRVREMTNLQKQNEKMMALGKLSAGLAHELNNPAAAVVRGADALQKQLESSAKQLLRLTALCLQEQEMLLAMQILREKEVLGEETLEQVRVRFRTEQRVENYEAVALFIFIGAKPVSDWLPKEMLRDEKGFVLTGKDLPLQADFKKRWKYFREPHLLESSIPGIFAAGDVRSGAMNRVASAVGEGAMAISFVHKYLAEI